MIKLFTIFLCLSLYLCASPAPARAEENAAGPEDTKVEKNREDEGVYHISIINLIATPEKYHGKKVLVHGVGDIEFEGNVVYLTEADWRYLNTKNGLWLSFDVAAVNVKKAKAFNGKPVLIEGVFNKEMTGHLDMCAGAIEKITRYELVRDLRKQFIQEDN